MYRIFLFIIITICAKILIFAADMTLLLDFGNTRVKAAVWDGTTLETVFSGRYTQDGLKDAVRMTDAEGGMWCAVHPLEKETERWLLSKGLSPLRWDTPVPIRNSYSTPQTLGMDRLAAAVGAWSMKPGQDLLVVDAGTAVTFDFVSADGIYKGGNIAPGIELRFRALHEHTGALPLVQSQGDVPMFGYDTPTAIRSGVINGIRKELEGYVNELRSIYPSLLVFLTGGDAEFFDIKAKSTTFAVPDLVLRGLARITEFNEKGI
jgi:type III pantothenate kinase